MDEEYDVWSIIFPLAPRLHPPGYRSWHRFDGVRLIRVTVGGGQEGPPYRQE